MKVVIHTDSSAAKSLASRKGLGKARHIHVNQLWVQEKVGDGVLEIRKVKGTDNIADALTKYVDSEILQAHMSHTQQEARPGRHCLMPSIVS